MIPQCIVSSEKGIDKEINKTKIDENLNKNIDNRAFSAILDALIPFDSQYPLSTDEDNNAYAGFYLISRNKTTSGEAFHEPVLVVIYKNEIKVLLPAQDANLRSFPEAICYLSKNKKNKTLKDQQVINRMLNQLSTEYSNADEIYLYVHTQNARTYWQWLQDEKFDKNNSPTKKITIMRIRDLTNNEVAQGYGLVTENEDFATESASFAQGIFIAPDCDINNIPFTQTVLSVAQKPQTLKSQTKNTSRFDPYTSGGNTKDPFPNTDWKEPQPRAHNILATPSLDKFILHHAIAHHLRSSHWWSADECEYPTPLSLARKIKEWCFSQ